MQQQRQAEADRNANLIKDGDEEDDGAIAQDDGDDDGDRRGGMGMDMNDGQSKVV